MVQKELEHQLQLQEDAAEKKKQQVRKRDLTLTMNPEPLN